MHRHRHTSQQPDEPEDDTRLASEGFDAAGDLARPDLIPPSAPAFDLTTDIGVDGPR